MTHEICPSCETVAHCMKAGCIPKQPQQEPVGQLKPCKEGWFADIDNPPPTDGVYETLDLYTSLPAQRKPWVGLTPDEINAIWHKHLHRDKRAQAIEAKLREKNT